MILARYVFIAGVFFVLSCAGAGAGADARPQTTTLCQANPKGTGILPDGDFSQAADPGQSFTEFSKGQAPAPDWIVTSQTVDFYGSKAFRVGGYCSIDMDGSMAGGVASQPFATQKGTLYYVTFILSGNGGSSPTVKTMRIGAAGQYLVFAWDVADGNDAQNGKWGKTTWIFRATGPSTTLTFQSLDPLKSASGAVIANISVSTTPPQGGN